MLRSNKNQGNHVLRQELLQKLIFCPASLNDTIVALRQFPWDWEREKPLIILTREAIKAILILYRDGTLTAQHVEDWANALESREDIGYEVGYEPIIGDVVYELANPYLTTSLSLESTETLLRQL